MNFFTKQNGLEIDYFYHCWLIQPNKTYDASPWRKIEADTLSGSDTIETDLKELYRPVACEYEYQKESFDDVQYQTTIAYKQTLRWEARIQNIKNTLSQTYSRTKVRDILDRYIQSNGVVYDMVIMTRFDIHCIPNSIPAVTIQKLDTSKVYIINRMGERKLFGDTFIIANTDLFLKWLNVYKNLNNIFSSVRVNLKCKELGEVLHINAEEVLFSSYIYSHKNLDRVVYVRGE